MMGNKYVFPSINEGKNTEIEISEPEVFPDLGIWHPLATNMFEDIKEYLKLHESHMFSDNPDHGVN